MVLKGRSVQRMNSLMLLGSITGAMTSGGALQASDIQIPMPLPMCFDGGRSTDRNFLVGRMHWKE